MAPRTQATAFDLEMAMAHIPVLTDELIDLLDLHADSRVVDCTLGGGGHAAAAGHRLGPGGLLICCDRDPVARGYFDELKAVLACPARFYLGNFADTLHQLNHTEFTATQVYLDLGVSSMQIDTQERGFSYSYDAPLDMRMDPRGSVTAEEIVNTWDERRLARIFREYGEERYARRIARTIIRNRARSPYTRTSELVETVKEAIPTPARFGSRNPARRVFQALRIAVNDELDSLRRALPEALALLEPGGVLAVISFHSLEDRIVKEFFVSQAHPCSCPPDFPVCVCGKTPSLEVLTAKAVTPGPQELATNPRSSSAKLRAGRKL